ncbi:hypothetical protein FCOIX_6136 [Fusarium coicis]|nr:hypothetical protein FCOIX_6136 [Fusarium coicis]
MNAPKQIGRQRLQANREYMESLSSHRPTNQDTTAIIPPAASQPTDKTQPDQPDKIDRIANHRSHPQHNEVMIIVKWKGDATTDKSEHIPQQDCPSLPYAYWDSQGGHNGATSFKEHHVFKVLRNKKAGCGVEFLVQWVGFRETDVTWEPRVKINKIAQSIVKELNNKGCESKGEFRSN